MIMMKVRFESELTEEQVYQVAEERLPQFREVPGLVQKYYLSCAEPNFYSGIYIWESEEAMKAFAQSELARTIPLAYKVKGQPTREFTQIFTTLRD